MLLIDLGVRGIQKRCYVFYTVYCNACGCGAVLTVERDEVTGKKILLILYKIVPHENDDLAVVGIGAYVIDCRIRYLSAFHFQRDAYIGIFI